MFCIPKSVVGNLVNGSSRSSSGLEKENALRGELEDGRGAVDHGRVEQPTIETEEFQFGGLATRHGHLALAMSRIGADDKRWCTSGGNAFRQIDSGEIDSDAFAIAVFATEGLDDSFVVSAGDQRREIEDWRGYNFLNKPKRVVAILHFPLSDIGAVLPSKAVALDEMVGCDSDIVNTSKIDTTEIATRGMEHHRVPFAINIVRAFGADIEVVVGIIFEIEIRNSQVGRG